jgi:catechol 2,3-dioxygenase-like lactoylglutathione lyase family enzyme
MTTLLSGFNHAALMTRDLDRLIEFYTGVFGAEVIFAEEAPMRHAMLRIGEHSHLHPVEMRDNPHAQGTAAMFDRGHVDHLGLNVATQEAFQEVRRRLIARGASDGVVSDLGPQLCMWFDDPDGMRAEVCWIRDRSQGFHAPEPLPSPVGD